MNEPGERPVAAGSAAAATGESADAGHGSGTDPASARSREPIATPRTPARPPEQRSAGLGRAIRIADAGPRYFYRSALVSLAVTCLLAIAIALQVRPPGALPPSQQTVIAVALTGLCVVVLLTLAALRWPPSRRGSWPDGIAAPEQRAAVWLALTAWFPLLLVVVYFKARSTLPPTVVWIAFGYLDKRWVTSAYLLGVLAPMLLLVAAARLLAAGREHPRNWRSWLSGLAPRRTRTPPSAGRPTPQAVQRTSPLRPAWRRFASATPARATAGILSMIAIAWYFYGPPWYLAGPAAAESAFRRMCS